MRKKRAVGGAIVFVLQCLECGDQIGSAIALRKISNPKNVRWFDQKLAHRPNPTLRKRNYQSRFRREDWKRLRSHVLERDGYECKNCGEPATEVHHKSYSRFGNERLSDLVASCGPCNRVEREQRIAAGVLGTR